MTKLFGVLSTTVLCLTLGATAPAFAQQEQKEDQKEAPARPEEKKAQPEKTPKPAEKAAATQEKVKPEEKAARPQEKSTNREATTSKHEVATQSKEQQHAQPAQHAATGRIPEATYRAHFGREHTFRVTEVDYRQNHRFQYGGYWFGFADPWPSNWLYTQDVFVVEINGVYYLCNAAFPGVNLALNITL